MAFRRRYYSGRRFMRGYGRSRFGRSRYGRRRYGGYRTRRRFITGGYRF